VGSRRYTTPSAPRLGAHALRVTDIRVYAVAFVRHQNQRSDRQYGTS
jgi:hypothetical protein